jgi:hypothetical protein
MSKDKRQDAVETQHVHEQGPGRDLIVPDSDVSFPADGELRQSDIEQRREDFAKAYENRVKQEFEDARRIALDRLNNGLDRGFDEASTADAIEGGEPYDFYQHLHNSENQSGSPRESGGKRDQTNERNYSKTQRVNPERTK